MSSMKLGFACDILNYFLILNFIDHFILYSNLGRVSLFLFNTYFKIFIVK